MPDRANETSEEIASLAAQVLRNPGASETERRLAGSDLTQDDARSEQTSREMASVAAKVLVDPKSSQEAKRLAASALSQREPSAPTKTTSARLGPTKASAPAKPAPAKAAPVKSAPAKTAPVKAPAKASPAGRPSRWR